MKKIEVKIRIVVIIQKGKMLLILTQKINKKMKIKLNQIQIMILMKLLKDISNKILFLFIIQIQKVQKEKIV